MNKFTAYFVFIAINLFAISTYAQAPVITASWDAFRQLKHERPGRGQHLKLDEIKGSPYLSSEFELGSILTGKNIRYINIPLRFNVYTDEIEFKTEDGSVLSIGFPGVIKEVLIGKKLFVYELYRADSKLLKSGYFQVLTKGKAVGLIKYRVMYSEAEPAAAYKDPLPPRFERKPAEYFISLDNKPALPVTNNKSVLSILRDKRSVLQSFIKKEKINVKRKNDLLRLLSYYNSL